MFKTILGSIIAIAAIAYFNDPKSLQPWEAIISQVGSVTAKAVKSAGEQAGDKVHKLICEDGISADCRKSSMDSTGASARNESIKNTESK